MGLLASSATLLFAAIGKTIVGTIFNDKPFYQNISQEVIDKIKGVFESPSAREQAAQTIDKLAAQVVQDLEPLLESEMGKIDESGMRSVLMEVDTALNATKIDVKTLINHQLDKIQLKTHILDANPRATRLFSTDETALYQRIIGELSAAILRITPQLPEFEATLSQFVVKKLDSLEAKVDAIQGAREREFQEFEERYRRSLIHELDRFEYFGLKRIDAISESQALTKAYIHTSTSLDIDSFLNFVIKNTDLFNKIMNDDENAYRLDLYGENISENLLDDLLGSTNSRIIIDPLISKLKNIDIGNILKIILKYQSLAGQGLRVVLRGDAGAGKSTFLQWLAISVAGNNLDEDYMHLKTLIPFFIRLRMFVDKRFPSPEEFPTIISPNYGNMAPKGWVQELLESGKALILIDGVDELPKTQREDFLRDLKQLVKHFPTSHYVITSRPGGLLDDNSQRWDRWEDWVEQEQFVNIALNPMSIDHINSFIKHWHHALITQQQDFMPVIGNRIRTLQNILRQRPELRVLASNPLLCAMICALYHERQETLPSGRIQLYRECIEMMLSRRDEGRRIPIGNLYAINLNDQQKLVFLKDLAHWLMKNNRSEVERDRVDKRFTKQVESLQMANKPTGGKIRDFFVERAGILREPLIGFIGFAHRTFQEYLAAEAIVNDDSMNELLNYAENDQWYETIIAAAGIARKRELNDFLRALIDKSAINNQYQSYLRMLALACFETGSMYINPDVSKKIIDDAHSLIPAKSQEDALKIARLGDIIVPLLIYDSFADIQETLLSIETLLHIGTPLALKILQGYTQEKSPPIIQKLSEGYSFFDIQQYQEIILSHLSFLIIENLTSDNYEVFNIKTHLKRLTIRKIEESIISKIQDFIHLSRLAVNNIKNYEYIWKISGLKQLYLEVFEDQSLDGIENLRHLNQLQLDFDSQSIVDLSVLTKLPNLKTLEIINLPYISNNKYSSKSDTIRNLHIHIKDNYYMDDININNIIDINKLEKIYIYGNIKNVNKILENSSLNTLLIAKNKSEMKLGFLENQQSLENLGLSIHELIDDLTINLNKLKKLQISSPTMKNINFINKFPNIESLTLGRVSSYNSSYYTLNHKIDISILSEISSIQELYLYRFNFVNFELVGSLKQLKRLRININNLGENLAHLGQLDKLESIEIHTTIVPNIEALASLKSLKHLTITALDRDGRQSIDLTSIKEFPALETLSLHEIIPLHLNTLNTMTHIKFWGSSHFRQQWIKMGGKLFNPQPMNDHI